MSILSVQTLLDFVKLLIYKELSAVRIVSSRIDGLWIKAPREPLRSHALSQRKSSKFGQVVESQAVYIG
jgi:hypothetical protein